MGQIEVNSDNFYEELPIGVMRVHPDPEARILMANRAAAQMFGYASVEELLQVPGGELMENPSVRAALMEELAAGGGVLGKEVRLKRRDGSPVWVSVRAKAVHSEGGEIQYIEAVAIDITRQKQVEESLRNSEARFRAIFESTAESIVVYDKDCNYLYANQAAIDHVGTSRDKVVGKN
ncbi:MAG TPA: PAS domain S-box protein, partial [Phycisphaerae bacterium]|nr:PAS domain S-box protein [Phycisphaerae bacterium]